MVLYRSKNWGDDKFLDKLSDDPILMKKRTFSLYLRLVMAVFLIGLIHAQEDSDLYQISPDDWRTGSGIWSKSDEGYTQKSKTGLSVLGLFHHKIKDVIIQYDCKFESFEGSASWAAASFRKSNPLNPYGGGGYMVYMRTNGNLELFFGGQGLQSVPTGIDTTQPFHVKISVIGKTLEVFVNSSLQPQMKANLSILTGGYLDLETTDACASFDSFTITKPIDE